jgi:hypothetical protein
MVLGVADAALGLRRLTYAGTEKGNGGKIEKKNHNTWAVHVFMRGMRGPWPRQQFPVWERPKCHGRPGLMSLGCRFPGLGVQGSN